MARITKYWVAALLVSTAMAQTQIDVRYQAKNVDFSNAPATRPVKVGTILPSTCVTGSLFFKSDAAPGSNLYGCTATNIWGLLSPAISTGSNTPVFCSDTGTANAYACSPTPAVSGYSAGLPVILQAGTTNTGTATLNVSGLGAAPLHKNDTQNLAAGDILAGQIIFAVYDGSAFQIQGAPAASGGGGGSATAAQLSSALACNGSSADGVTYTCTVSGVSSYAASLTLLFVPNINSGNSPTLNINGLGSIPLLRSSSNGIGSGELVAHTPYLISFDGTAFRMAGEQIEADGTGTISINRGVFPHTIGITPNVFGQLSGSNTWVGNNDFSGGYMIWPTLKVSNFPAASSNSGKIFVASDGASASDCSTGGGATPVLCRSNGSVWAALGGGGGGSAGFSVSSVNTSSTSAACSDNLVLASVSVPGNTLHVGDVVEVDASDYAPAADTTYASQIVFGAGSAPNCCFSLLGWSQKSHTYTLRYVVMGSSSERVSGTATGGVNVPYNAGTDWTDNPISQNVANATTISLRIAAGTCSQAGNVAYSHLTARVLR